VLDAGPDRRGHPRQVRRWLHLTRQNINQLTALVKTRLKRMQYRPALLGGFLASTGLDLTPFCNSHD
jgi:hypothetical protein